MSVKDNLSDAEKAWQKYRDEMTRIVPARQLRRRDFISGWDAAMAHADERVLTLGGPTDRDGDRPDEVAASFLREAYLAGKHGESRGWRLWKRADDLDREMRHRLATLIEAVARVDWELTGPAAARHAAEIVRGES